MSIAFFTEGGYTGKIPRNNPNMRTDQAWMCALDATHYCVFQLEQVTQKYDIGVVIIPKEKNREHLANQNYPIIKNLKNICGKILVMQESTHWDWQDEPFNAMVWYYNQLIEADGILCHNDIDVPYFKGITNNKSFVFPTLMIEDNVKTAMQRVATRTTIVDPLSSSHPGQLHLSSSCLVSPEN